MKSCTKVLIVLGLISMGRMGGASFEENQHRYLTAREIVQTLGTFLPFVGLDGCGLKKTFVFTSLDAFGENTPLTGTPILKGPTQATINAIASCVTAVFDKNEISSFDDAKLKMIFASEDVFQVIQTVAEKNAIGSASLHQILSLQWNKFSEIEKKQMIAFFVDVYLGSDEAIKDFGLIQSPEIFRQSLFEKTELYAEKEFIVVLRYIITNLILRDEFLSY